MSENTKIEWCDHTFNPWIGCTQVGPGCDNCYAKAFDRRFAVSGHAMHWGVGVARKRTGDANWRLPLKWDRAAEANGTRPKVFCASLADVFDNFVDSDWRNDLSALIYDTPNLDWLLLTKRIGNALEMLEEMFLVPRKNVWLGATICNQEEADRDIPKLLAVPAAKRFLSMEPLLGPVDLTHWIGLQPTIGATTYRDDKDIYRCDLTGTPVDGIDWVIVGGESGPNARPMHPDWARSLRDQCEAAGVPFLFKQWGEWREPLDGEEYDTSMGRAAKPPAFIISHDGTVRCFKDERFTDSKVVIMVGKKAAGRLLDGREWNGVPA